MYSDDFKDICGFLEGFLGIRMFTLKYAAFFSLPEYGDDAKLH